MEWILLLVPLLMTLGVAIALILAYRLHQWNSIYRELAKKYRGQFYLRFLLPQLAFRYGQQSIRIENYHRRFFWRRPVTRLQMPWPDRQTVFEVTNQNFGSHLWGGFRYTQLTWNDPTLDASLITRLGSGNQERAWIHAEANQRLTQLLQRLQPRSFNLLIRRGLATVTCGPFLNSKQQLEDLLQLSWQLIDQWRIGQPVGLDFVAAEKLAITAQSTCPVCNQHLTSPVAVCVRCRTPHCQECWEYNGGCATFACGEKRCDSTQL